MRPTPTATVSLVLVAAMLGLVACETREGAPPPNSTQPVQLTFLPEPWLLAIHPASGRATPMVRWHLAQARQDAQAE